MTIEKRVSLYEVLYRFEGETLKGIHQISLERVIDTETNEVMAEKALPAEPITAEAATKLLGEEVSRFSNAIAERDVELAGLRAKVERLKAINTDLVTTAQNKEEQRQEAARRVALDRH